MIFMFDYEEDVGKNSFNVLRMFLYIYGPREAPTRLAEFIGKSEVKYQKLLGELEPNIRVKYQKRCEEAVKEGGSKSVHLLGSWTIPFSYYRRGCLSKADHVRTGVYIECRAVIDSRLKSKQFRSNRLLHFRFVIAERQGGGSLMGGGCSHDPPEFSH